MNYSAEISRTHPSCLLFVVDQSGSMRSPCDSTSTSTAQVVADVVNRLLYDVILRCARSDGIRDYSDVGVVGYRAGEDGRLYAESAMGGVLSGSWFHPVRRVAQSLLRLEPRTRWPVWVEPVASGRTPMSAALERVREQLGRWIAIHGDSLPPVVIHLTDGHSTDGAPYAAMKAIADLRTSDGNVLLFNLHYASRYDRSAEGGDAIGDTPVEGTRSLHAFLQEVVAATDGSPAESLRMLIDTTFARTVGRLRNSRLTAGEVMVLSVEMTEDRSLRMDTSWPSASDYAEALRCPRIAFMDPELRNAAPLDGTPGRDVIGGSRACIFRIRDGRQSWAVKCFTRPPGRRLDRYAALSRVIENSGLPYFVGYRLVVDGIRVPGYEGRSFPLLKMDWVEGLQLDAFVERNLGHSTLLLDLAGDWLRLAMDLERAGIVHGDLHHGNVLVTAAGLRLVDYDAMPAGPAVGRELGEVGHWNYQHPSRRSQSPAVPTLDRFSAWVIFLSLRALAAAPELWTEFHGGDDKLLFDVHDFEQPQSSPILQRMRLAGPPLRDLAATLDRVIEAAALQNVPPLNPATTGMRP